MRPMATCTRRSRSGLPVAASRHPAAQLTDVHTVENPLPMTFISAFDYTRWLSASAVIAVLYLFMAGRGGAFGVYRGVRPARPPAPLSSQKNDPARQTREYRNPHQYTRTDC